MSTRRWTACVFSIRWNPMATSSCWMTSNGRTGIGKGNCWSPPDAESFKCEVCIPSITRSNSKRIYLFSSRTPPQPPSGPGTGSSQLVNDVDPAKEQKVRSLPKGTAPDTQRPSEGKFPAGLAAKKETSCRIISWLKSFRCRVFPWAPRARTVPTLLLFCCRSAFSGSCQRFFPFCFSRKKGVDPPSRSPRF